MSVMLKMVVLAANSVGQPVLVTQAVPFEQGVVSSSYYREKAVQCALAEDYRAPAWAFSAPDDAAKMLTLLAEFSCPLYNTVSVLAATEEGTVDLVLFSDAVYEESRTFDFQEKKKWAIETAKANGYSWPFLAFDSQQIDANTVRRVRDWLFAPSAAN